MSYGRAKYKSRDRERKKLPKQIPGMAYIEIKMRCLRTKEHFHDKSNQFSFFFFCRTKKSVFGFVSVSRFGNFIGPASSSKMLGTFLLNMIRFNTKIIGTSRRVIEWMLWNFGILVAFIIGATIFEVVVTWNRSNLATFWYPSTICMTTFNPTRLD